MDKKKSFLIFAPEFLAITSRMTNAQKGELMTLICEFVLFGHVSRKIPEVINDAFVFMQESIAQNLIKYNEVCEKRKKAVAVRINKSLSSDNQKIEDCTSNPYQKPSDNEYENKNDIKNENENENGSLNGFSPPKVEDVEFYCKLRGFKNFNAEEFVRFYGSKGWQTPAGKITDWQRKVIQWAGAEDKDSFKSFGNCLRFPKLVSGGDVR